MKKIILGFATIALLIAESISCEQKANLTDISLEYQKCDCDRETEYVKMVTADNILLLDVKKATRELILKLSENEEKPFKYVICDFATMNATFTTGIGEYMVGHSEICNFPFDFSWKIPENGIRISIIAEEYEKCKPQSSTSNFYSDIILTSLKIQTK